MNDDAREYAVVALNPLGHHCEGNTLQFPVERSAIRGKIILRDNDFLRPNGANSIILLHYSSSGNKSYEPIINIIVASDTIIT